MNTIKKIISSKAFIGLIVMLAIVGFFYISYSSYKANRQLRSDLLESKNTIEKLREDMKEIEDEISQLEEEIERIDGKIDSTIDDGKDKIEKALKNKEKNPDNLIKEFYDSWR